MARTSVCLTRITRSEVARVRLNKVSKVKDPLLKSPLLSFDPNQTLNHFNTTNSHNSQAGSVGGRPLICTLMNVKTEASKFFPNKLTKIPLTQFKETVRSSTCPSNYS